MWRRCGNCLQRAECAKAADVLTWKFGSWDDVQADDGGRWLCLPCAWAYREARYRRSISMVHGDALVQWPTPKTWTSMLLSGPLPLDVALVVPVGGKRVVLPRAQWGKVATDGRTFTWSPRHKRVLEAGVALLQVGASRQSLREAGPPFWLVKEAGERLPIKELHRLWRGFNPARKDKVMLEMYLRLLGTDRERDEDA